MADYMTFQNLYQTVMLAIGDSQYARTTEVKAIINQVYLNEVLQCDPLYPLFWLIALDDAKTAKAPVTYTAITKANPPVVTATAHGLVSGDLVTFYGEAAMTELNYRTFRVVKDNANAFHLHDLDNVNIDASAYGAAGTGGTAHNRGTVITSTPKIITANWHGYDKGMDFIGPEQLEGQATWWDVSTSRPLKCMHQQRFTAAGGQADNFFWFQGSDAAYSLRLWYVQQPARLSDDANVPLLPSQFHDAIVAGSITRLGENKVQVEAGVVWPELYVRELDAIKEFNRAWWKDHIREYERSGLFLA